jgi:hypothetical protein
LQINDITLTLTEKATHKDLALLESAAYFIMMSSAEIADDIVDDSERGEFGNITKANSSSDNWLIAKIYSELDKAHRDKDESKFTSYIKDIYSYGPNEFFDIVNITIDKIAEGDSAMEFKHALRESARVMMLAADGLVDDAEQMYLEYLDNVFSISVTR